MSASLEAACAQFMLDVGKEAAPYIGKGCTSWVNQLPHGAWIETYRPKCAIKAIK